MGHGRFSDLYNPHWGRNVENASFLWDGGVGEVDGSAAPNGTDLELLASTVFFLFAVFICFCNHSSRSRQKEINLCLAAFIRASDIMRCCDFA